MTVFINYGTMNSSHILCRFKERETLGENDRCANVTAISNLKEEEASDGGQKKVRFVNEYELAKSSSLLSLYYTASTNISETFTQYKS